MSAILSLLFVSVRFATLWRTRTRPSRYRRLARFGIIQLVFASTSVAIQRLSADIRALSRGSRHPLSP